MLFACYISEVKELHSEIAISQRDKNEQLWKEFNSKLYYCKRFKPLQLNGNPNNIMLHAVFIDTFNETLAFTLYLQQLLLLLLIRA